MIKHRPAPQALSRTQLLSMSAEELLQEVHTRRQLDPLTLALAIKLDQSIRRFDPENAKRKGETDPEKLSYLLQEQAL